MRDRINCLIDSITDPFSTEIRYHHRCWLRYVGAYQRMSVDEKLPYLHEVTLREAQTMFIDHAREVIFCDHEIRTLQGLLRDYKSIVGMYGLPMLGVKSSYVKELLVREFGAGIAFYVPPQRNQSEVVYDTSGGGSYIGAAISLLGISSEQLIQNVANRLRDEIRQTVKVPWPPQVSELEQEEDLSPLLVQLISLLKKTGQAKPDAKTCALASMLTYHVTGSPTITTVNLGMNLHGLTRSKELVDTFHKVGACIGYGLVRLLRDAWAVHDLQLCTDCPNEIMEDKAGVIIVDNDDFHNDTLTGANTSHRTNVMYVQRDSLEDQGPQCGDRVKDAKTLSSALKEIAAGMQKHDRYITHKRGEPPVKNRVQPSLGGIKPQRKRSVIHSLVRANSAGERPVANDQKIPSFAGFQALISAPVVKSKAYYFMTYSEPPKKAVLNDVMLKVKGAIERKHMPFAVVVGDQPVYTLLVEIRSEHPHEYSKIIPFLGPFHTHGCMIYAIYKRHKGCGIAEVLVAAGVIAEGSVDQALRGKHYRRALRCLTLMYEALMHLLLKKCPNESELDASTRAQLAVLREPNVNSQESLAAAHEKLQNDPAIDTLISKVFEEIEGSDMANFWFDFMKMVEILMMNVHAVHTCNWEEYIASLQKMMPWLIIYDQTNYGRWLPDFWATLSTLPAEQVQFLRSNFAQSMTGNPYSSIPWDLWIEMTMNKGSKMKAGWLSILRNEKQLLADTRNVNNLGRIRAALHNQVNRKQLSRKHKECAPARMCMDEQALQDLILCMREFGCFPFDPALPILRPLQSAIPAPPELIRDFQTAREDGELRLETFLEERVYTKERSLHDRVKRNSRLTFANTPISKVTGENLKLKQGEMESRALAAVVNLVDISGLLSLSEVLKYRLAEECLALFNVNGTFRKTQKSKLLQNGEQERSSFSSEMEVAKLSAPPNLEVRYVSCNESAKKRCLSSELKETVVSLTHKLFMTQH